MAKIYRTIRIEEENYRRLMSIKGFFENKFRRHFSLNDVIQTLLDLYDERGGEFFASTLDELGFSLRRISRRGGESKR